MKMIKIEKKMLIRFRKKMNHFDKLPFELIQKIFTYAESYIPFIRLTCKVFNSIVCNDMYLKKFLNIDKSIFKNNDHLLIWCNKFYNKEKILEIVCQVSSLSTLHYLYPYMIFTIDHLVLSLKNENIDMYKYISYSILKDKCYDNENYNELDVKHFSMLKQFLSDNDFYNIIINCFYGNHNIYILDIIYVYINSILDSDLWFNNFVIFQNALGDIIPKTIEQKEIYEMLIIWIIDMIDKNQSLKERWINTIDSKYNCKYSMLIYEPLLLHICKTRNINILNIIFENNFITKGYNEILSKDNRIELIHKSIINLIKTASYYGYVDILQLFDQYLPIVKDIYAFYIILMEACHLGNENINDDIIHIPVLQWLYEHNNYNQYLNNYNLQIVLEKANKYNNQEFNYWYPLTIQRF